MNRKLALALLAASVTSGCSLTLDAEEVAPWENVESWCYAAVDLVMELEASCTPMTSDYESYQYRIFSEAFLDCAGLQETEDAGRVRFDSGAAKRCLEELAAGDCFSDQEACEGTVQGAVHEGGACTSYRDCAADTNGCDFSLSCPGTCRPLGGWGNPCNDHEECKSDFYCQFATMSCQYRVGAYATCAVGDPPEKCPDGYYCGFDSMGQRCIPRPGLGEYCDGSVPCDDQLGLACDPYASQCVTLPVPPSAIGGLCAWPYRCDEATAFCDGTSCQPRRPLDQGYVCDYDAQCAFPGSCSVVQGEPSRTCQCPSAGSASPVWVGTASAWRAVTATLRTTSAGPVARCPCSGSPASPRRPRRRSPASAAPATAPWGLARPASRTPGRVIPATNLGRSRATSSRGSPAIPAAPPASQRSAAASSSPRARLPKGPHLPGRRESAHSCVAAPTHGGTIMIPAMIDAHLREHHRVYEHHRHAVAMTAQELAASEHVSGYRVAKAVVVKLDGRLAIAVVAATDRVALGMLEEATASTAELVAEADFIDKFRPCEAGAEPPLALFGLPIFVDEKLLHEKKLLMPAGTHEDAIALDTHEWIKCEEVQPVANLGIHVGEHRS